MKRHRGEGVEVALHLLACLQAARLSGDEFRISMADAELERFDAARKYYRRLNVEPVPGPARPFTASEKRARSTTRAGRRHDAQVGTRVPTRDG